MKSPNASCRLDLAFDQQVWRTPDAIAVYDAHAAITFAELKARVDSLQRSLRGRGIAAGSYVGVHLQRSLDYVVCVLAILKANATVVPLPPTYPERRLREILAFAALDAVLDDATTPLHPHSSDCIIHLSDLGKVNDTLDPVVPGEPEQPAFVLCSSGSTGTPKMIVRSHRSFFHRLQWTWDNHPYTHDEVCCQKSHMATTHAIYELFEPLLRGVPLCMISDQQVQCIESFWETIRTQRISRLLIVPSLLQAALDIPGFVAPTLRVLVLMGEHVPTKLAERVLAAFPAQTKVYSIYGSTEASSTLACDIRANFRAGAELVLGTPIAPDIQALVLAADSAPVAVGEVGVLHIAGPALFSGYFKDPVLTASVTTTTPGVDGQLYNSHDQVRRMAHGELAYVGRVDHTVKIRGFRVDLQEVENALMRHPEVRQCAVMVVDNGSESSLLACVVPATITQHSLYAVLREQLPGYMVPSTVIGLDRLPLTASGKVDRQHLLTRHAGRAATSADVFPSNTAQAVAAVWAALLKYAPVGPESSFFEVGGTSLNAFAVVQHLRDAFALDRQQLGDACIYQYQTVSTLAAHIDDLCHGARPQTSAGKVILSTLKGGDTALPPLFVIASAGGTLGAYDKFVRALDTRRAVIGVRDPFLWGARDPAAGFGHWIASYLEAIRAHQPSGPYYLLAYSSAGAFGYEIAQQLRRQNEEVALLALVDPLAMDRASKARFGYWALQARFMRAPLARVVMLGGWLRGLLPRWLRSDGRSAPSDDTGLSQEQFAQASTRSLTSKEHILALSVLLELNSGLAFALGADDLSQVAPANYLEMLLARAKNAAPEVSREMIENIAVQYNLQVHAHHRYRLRRYDSKVVIFDTKGPCSGLLAAQFRPYVDDLDVREIALGKPSARTLSLAGIFPENIRSHYLSMRDETFVHTLAGELTGLLR